MQQYLEDSERDLIFQSLQSIPENKKCADCPEKNPSWASVYLGLFLCYDCAGKHRQYGVHYSFVRSLELDKWNKRQVTFMEIGGNAKAQKYFTQHGLNAPIDYKSTIVTNYKDEQTKKVDAMLKQTEPVEKIESPGIERENVSDVAGIFRMKSDASKASSGDEAGASDSVRIDKEQTKTKGFAVQFTKSKSCSATKGRIAARKIDNVDFDMLTLEDGNLQTSGTKMGSVTNPAPIAGKESEINKEKFVTPVKSANVFELTDEEKLKKYKSAKSISSRDFLNNENEDRQNPTMDVKRFSNATSISSSQYFGTTEDQSSKRVGNAKEFLSNVGDKLKEKAGSIGAALGKLNAKLQERNKDVDPVLANVFI